MTSEIISFENYLPGDLGIEAIVLRLGKMLAAIPNVSISNPLVYHSALINEVSVVPGLSHAALESGCRTIEREWKGDHAPPIAVVIDALKEAVDRWPAQSRENAGGERR